MSSGLKIIVIIGATIGLSGACWAPQGGRGSQGISQNTSGVCNPATVAGGNVTITCQGLDPALIKQLHLVLNKIAANQLDPNAVLMKLDELRAETHDIKVGVDEIRKRQEGRRLSTDQKGLLVARLKSVATKSRIKIMMTNSTPESTRFAEDFQGVFEAAGWAVEMFPNMSAGSVLPKGQSLFVKSADNQVAGYIQNLFKGIGVTLVGALGTDVESDLIVIAVWPSPEN